MSHYSTPTSTFTHRPAPVTSSKGQDMTRRANISPKHLMSIVSGMKMLASQHLGSGNSTAMIHSSCQKHRCVLSSASCSEAALRCLNTSRAHLVDNNRESVDHVGTLTGRMSRKITEKVPKYFAQSYFRVRSDAVHRRRRTILILRRHHPVLDATFIVGNPSIPDFDHDHSYSFTFYEMTPAAITSSGMR